MIPVTGVSILNLLVFHRLGRRDGGFAWRLMTLNWLSGNRGW